MTTWDDENNDARRQADQGLFGALWSVRSFRSFTVLSVVGLACVMGACAESVAGPSPTESEQAAKIKDVTADFDKVKSEHEGFTIEGRPTKTIETPWGPREIYDPAQDEEVRKAFERLYSSNDTVIYTFKNADGELLWRARSSLMYQLTREVCRGVLDASCTRYASICKENNWPRPQKEKWPECESYELSYPPGHELFLDPGYKTNPLYAGVPNAKKGVVLCEINNTEIISTNYKTIGKSSLESLNDQFDGFFAYNCHQPLP